MWWRRPQSRRRLMSIYPDKKGGLGTTLETIWAR
jgi:hypothetical protein